VGDFEGKLEANAATTSTTTTAELPQHFTNGFIWMENLLANSVQLWG
jgi:hypothetical protein